MLSAEQFKAGFTYDPETGDFQKIRKIGNRVAGYINHHGYRVIRVGVKAYQAHRLAFLYMTGSIPECDIDHINGDKSDNRFTNLRSASRSENSQNRWHKSVGTSKLLGVSWFADSGKWQAQIKINGKGYYLGLHDTEEAAHAAYLEGKRKYHPDFGEIAKLP